MQPFIHYSPIVCYLHILHRGNSMLPLCVADVEEYREYIALGFALLPSCWNTIMPNNYKFQRELSGGFIGCRHGFRGFWYIQLGEYKYLRQDWRVGKGYCSFPFNLSVQRPSFYQK